MRWFHNSMLYCGCQVPAHLAQAGICNVVIVDEARKRLLCAQIPNSVCPNHCRADHQLASKKWPRKNVRTSDDDKNRLTSWPIYVRVSHINRDDSCNQRCPYTFIIRCFRTSRRRNSAVPSAAVSMAPRSSGP